MSLSRQSGVASEAAKSKNGFCFPKLFFVAGIDRARKRDVAGNDRAAKEKERSEENSRSGGATMLVNGGYYYWSSGYWFLPGGYDLGHRSTDSGDIGSSLSRIWQGFDSPHEG